MTIVGFTNQWTARLAHRFPQGRFVRYLFVGIGNTLFSYGAYAALTRILTPHVRYAYVFAGLLGNLLNITFSYLTYKWFVFETKGNYVREWMRCVAVYIGAGLLGTAALPVLVFLIRRLTTLHGAAPYLAGGIVSASAVVVSFTGHKRFTFRPTGS